MGRFSELIDVNREQAAAELEALCGKATLTAADESRVVSLCKALGIGGAVADRAIALHAEQRGCEAHAATLVAAEGNAAAAHGQYERILRDQAANAERFKTALHDGEARIALANSEVNGCKAALKRALDIDRKLKLLFGREEKSCMVPTAMAAGVRKEWTAPGVGPIGTIGTEQDDD